MWSLRKSLIYEPVTQNDSEVDLGRPSTSKQTPDSYWHAQEIWNSKFVRKWVLFSLTFLFILVLGQLVLSKHLLNALKTKSTPLRTCTNPVRRVEWRQLSANEKAEYISAVKCLHELPSQINDEGRLSDDFPWVHRHIGSFTHNAAPFLAWHRYLILVYENMLRGQCGYHGHLTYWDWTLDFASPPTSPIWSPITGFGGDGDPSAPPIIGHATCIASGPFENYEVQYFNNFSDPHCLSRGFGRESPYLFSGETFSPNAIEEVMAQDSFFNFSLALEKGPHNAIPNGIGGDFLTFEAPSDPVFFLHHTQLDRLWWMWQSEEEGRLGDYDGPNRAHSDVPASLDDVLPMNGLAEDVLVKDIMNTKSDMLCYEY